MSTFAFAATVPGRILIPAPGTSLTLTVVFAATVPGRLGFGQDRHVRLVPGAGIRMRPGTVAAMQTST